MLLVMQGPPATSALVRSIRTGLRVASPKPMRLIRASSSAPLLKERTNSAV